MKIDLIYPKIPENSGLLKRFIAFEKYDGTNLHWCWNKNDGWHAFGTRRTQFSLNKKGIKEFNETHPELFSAPLIFNDLLRDKLIVSFSKDEWLFYNKIIVFTEFFGPNSFAGTHSIEDFAEDTQQLVIIDVSVSNRIMDPELFVEYFQSLPIARIVEQGTYNGQFSDDIRQDKYHLNEGVVCKGIVDGKVFMTKIKTKDYLKRLRQR